MRPADVVQAWVAAFNAGDVDALAGLYAEGAVNHQVVAAPVAGRAAIREMFEREFAEAKMACIVENLFEDGDWAILEWRDPLGLRGCGFFRIRNSVIELQRGYWDRLTFFQQHGLPIPEPESCGQVVRTDRLVMRRICADDAEFMLGLLNQPSFIRNIGDRGVRSVSDAIDYIQSGTFASYAQFGFGMYMVESAADRIRIGVCGLVKRDSLPDVDIGFAFLPEYWGQGYAFESALAVKNYAMETLGLEKLIAITAPDNHGSINVLEKIGLGYDRLVRLPDDDTELKLYSSDV